MLTFLDRIRLHLAPGDAVGTGSPSSAGAEAGGGAPGSAADAGDEGVSVEEVADGAEAQASADADDGDDADDDYADLDQANPRIKSLVTRTRKLARQQRRHREIVDGMRGPGGRFLNPTQLRQKAEYWDRVEARATTNPKLRAALFGDDDEPAAAGKPAKAAAGAADDDPFAAFDPDHPATPLLKKLYENNQALQLRVDDLDRGFKQNETRQTEAQQRAEVTAWTEAITSASKSLPKIIKLPTGGTLNLRDVFEDSVKGAYIAARQQGKRLDVSKVIAHYLRQAGVNPTRAGQLAADAQRAAEHNKTLPRAGAVVPGGRPSPARVTKETVADVSKRIQGRR